MKPDKSYQGIIERITELTRSGEIKWGPNPFNALAETLGGGIVGMYTASYSGHKLRLTAFSYGQPVLELMYNDLVPSLTFPHVENMSALLDSVILQVSQLDSFIKSLWKEGSKGESDEFR